MAEEFLWILRAAPQELMDQADLGTEMREVKHWYQAGVPMWKRVEQ